MAVMITNYLLLGVSLWVLYQAVVKFRDLDSWPDECRPGLKKDIGLMIVATAIYIGLEVKWIQESYYSLIKLTDEYGWTVQEMLTKIIFLRVLWRVNLYKNNKNKEEMCDDFE